MIYSRVFYPNPANQNYLDDELVEIASKFGGRFVDAEDEIPDGVCPDCGEEFEPIRILLFEYRTRARRDRGERAMDLYLAWCEGFADGMMAAAMEEEED
jgi:hypothetical protein